MLRIGAADVVLTVGGRLHCRIPRRAIARAERATWRSVPDPAMAREYVNTAKPLEPNVMLMFGEPVHARLPFGIRKRLTRLGVRVAEPERLILELSTASTQSPR